MIFLEKLDQAVEQNNSLLCIGLDTDIHHLPSHLLDSEDPVFAFNKAIIEATSDLVCAYKPNSAYYEADGFDGMASLEKTLAYLRENHPHIPVIFDGKRGDIASTSDHYAMAAFDYFQVDAMTLSPYMGKDSLEPFLRRKEKGCIILCRTSNAGASDFQELLVQDKPLYLHVVKEVLKWHQEYQNCLIVVGATAPQQMQDIRNVADSMWFLVPGVGVQGGNLEAILKAGLRKDTKGLIINSSRSIIYASNGEDFAEKARTEAEKIRDTINIYR